MKPYNSIRICLFFVMITLTCCSINSEKRYFDNLSRYLATDHKVTIPDDTCHFFIFPSKGCQTCALAFFDYVRNTSFKKENVFIVAHQNYYIDSVEYNSRILWDKSGKIARLDLDIASTAYISTYDGTILEKIEVTPLNKDSLQNELSITLIAKSTK